MASIDISQIINDCNKSPQLMVINYQKKKVVSQSLKENFDVVICLNKGRRVVNSNFLYKIFEVVKNEYSNDYVWTLLSNYKGEHFILGKKQIN